MSNRDEQPFRFACEECGSAIDIDVKKGGKSEFNGASEVVPSLYPFDDKTNFVDLHLDFPVVFGKYVPGITPFMAALDRIGLDKMRFHNARLNFLNSQAFRFGSFKSLLNLYATKKFEIFKTNCRDHFDRNVNSSRPEYIAAALYGIISEIMMPFGFYQTEMSESELICYKLQYIKRNNRAALLSFVERVLANDFLIRAQNDCLGVYPRILDAELALRPVLFLDLDDGFRDKSIPMRISSVAFESYRDLYKDISEIVSRQLVFVAGVNNLLKRGDHNKFKPASSGTRAPRNLAAFADVALGSKADFIDDDWFNVARESAIDNHLRNAIAHHKTEYDTIKQIITYYPVLDGMDNQRREQISLVQFMRRLLLAYREMHRFQQLTKCIFFTRYLSFPTL
ncbi:hypothetical protein [Bradyrhizobium symbiodeficiens]|uniref:hypothetical protein n=1 Tax=Bradyrhizobium symbiodeficiens TaxID=1404367 RepID=UPI00140F610E|nr:hypothetical protein [Bradyrhizobium symbiodeficiens]QIP00303.1 hypothetical protein HAU86_10990 [Bradyrhizobium symbiodeficiens]